MIHRDNQPLLWLTPADVARKIIFMLADQDDERVQLIIEYHQRTIDEERRCCSDETKTNRGVA